MSSPKKCLSAAIDRERKVAHITIAHDDGARFEGDYCEEDARGLTGAIVNSANFLDIIEDLASLDNPGCTLEASPYSSKTIIKLHAVATVGRVSLADDIEIICPRVATGDAYVAIEKYRAELAERDTRIMTLERDLTRVAALAEFTIRWGNLPFENAALWREVVNRELSGDPIVFPVIGCHFVMMGDKKIPCPYQSIKTHCIYCQTIYIHSETNKNNIGIETVLKNRNKYDDCVYFQNLSHVIVEIGHTGGLWAGLRARITDKTWNLKTDHQFGQQITVAHELQVEPQLFLGMTLAGGVIDWLSKDPPAPIAPEFFEAQRITAEFLAKYSR
jgi:hypothetical protein